MNATENAPAKEREEIVLRPHFHSTEDDNGATLRIALPGVRKEDLQLTLRESNLTIEARRDDDVPEGWKTHRDTGRSGRCELNIRLTRRFDGSKAEAKLDAGVLTLLVPVREEAKPRQIAVN